MQGQYDPEYKRIVEAISAIIFLSTPHRGTNLAETLNRILQASIISSSKQFISELTKNSSTLQKLNEQFRHIAPKLDIVSFYETQMTPIGINKNKIMVLERDSSVLGYPGEISKALDADHHGVCKYDSPEDPLYVTVRNVLKSLISKFPPPGTLNPAVASKHEDLREVETLLAVSEPPDTDYVFFRDRWAPNTCDWILDQKAFVEWMQSETGASRILWLYGPAASGKSVLSSYIINHLAEVGLPCQYFFVRFLDQGKRSVANLLRSLAFQIAQSLPTFREGIRRLVVEATKLNNADAQTTWNRVFKSVLFKLRYDVPLYWVIDGLEESDDPRILIRLLADVEHSSVPIRVLIVSRRTQGLVSSFQRLSKGVQLDIVPYESNPNDIQRFVDQELDVSGDADFRVFVVEQILERARGNFLWTNLAVKRINDCHTRADVNTALQQLPAGMEALYDKMASTVAALQQQEDKHLASTILSWVTCALRLLTLEELSLVLEKDESRPLDLQRSVGDLCGGFVVLDNDGNVAMVHQTAREYLVAGPSRPYTIDLTAAHEQLFMTCMDCLRDSGLRSKINRRQAPKFLDYAATSWFYHLSQSSAESQQIFATLKFFLGNPSVLTWVQALAQANRLRTLVLASTHLTNFAARLKRNEQDHSSTQHTRYLELWSTDLVKIVGKFGSNLLRNPESIYKLIPPFCPNESVVYQQFGRKESNSLKVTGHFESGWDDSLARLSFGSGVHATAIKAAGGRIAVMSPSGTIIVYYASTCEESRRIKHGERVLKSHLNLSGTLLVTYGYLTTKVWDLKTGRCVCSAPNPPDRPRPHTIIMTMEDKSILVGTDDRKIRCLSLTDSTPCWMIIADIDEQALEGTIVGSPICMALSPDGTNVALGYRGHPLSVWELEGPELVGHCLRVFDDSTRTHASHAWGEIVHVTWHPYNGEVIGLYREGVVFRWHPYHDETQEIRTGANFISVSPDAKCLATGDPNGIVKLYDLAGFYLVYQFAAQDPVFDLCFAPDSRRLYDVRGLYANVWEPAALLRLSEETDSSNSSSTHVDNTVLHMSRKIDPVMALASPPVGNVFCSGTESGVISVTDPDRSASMEIRKSQSFMSIEHIAWSGDGKCVGFTDLSGRVFVRLMGASNMEAGGWAKEANIEIAMNRGQGHVSQLLFHPTLDRLLIYSASNFSVVSLPSGQIIDSHDIEGAERDLKWMNHPQREDTLLAIGPSVLHVWSWMRLTCTAHMRFPLPNKDRQGSIPLNRTSSTLNLWETRERVDRVLVTTNKTHVLFQISFPGYEGQKQKEVLVFDASKIPTATDAETPSDSGNPAASPALNKDAKQLAPLTLPPDLLSQVETPLSFLSRDRLVFLDSDFWVCSWRLPLASASTSTRSASIPNTTASAAAPRRPSVPGSLDGGTAEIKRHFFLPGDWISPDTVALCTVMANGAVACPRGGRVAVVGCTGLKG